MPFHLPEWAEARLRGVTRAEIDQALAAPKRLARPSTGGPGHVTLIAGRTESGRPLLVVVDKISAFEWRIISAAELDGENLSDFETWEEQADEPFEG